MTNNDRALRSAQTMHDRAADDRTDFSDWYGSDHYQLWLSDMVDHLIAGRSCHGFDRAELQRIVQDLTLNADYNELSDTSKAAVDGLTEYMDVHLLALKSDDAKDQSIAGILRTAMYDSWRPLASKLAEQKAEDYFYQELAK